MLLLPPFSLWMKRERRKLYLNRYRARQQGLPATLGIAEWMKILKAHNWLCVFCGRPYQSLEHVIPIHDGGGTTPENCVPSCIDCNYKRNRVVTNAQNLVTLMQNNAYVVDDYIQELLDELAPFIS